MRTVRSRIPLLALAFALLLVACSSGDDGAEPDSTTTSTPASTTTVSTTTTSSTTSTTTTTTTTTTATTTTLAPLPDTGLAAPGTRTLWSGTIDDDIGFSLWLAQQGIHLRGELTYTSVGEPITIVGLIRDTGLVVLHEFDPAGNITGTLGFDHAAGQTAITDGFWSERSLSLTYAGMSDAPYFFDPLVRPGDYRFQFAPFDEDDERCCAAAGLLRISDVSDAEVTVEFNNHRGAPGYNIAYVEPVTLTLDGNRAVYERVDEFDDCAFEIVVFDGFAYVDHVDDRWECGFGNGATVTGVYVLEGRFA